MDSSFKGADNKVYHLSPLTLGDLKSFANYCAFRPYYMMKEQADEAGIDVTGELKRCFADCANKGSRLDSSSVDEASNTIDGAIHLLFLSLRRNHPSITTDTVGEIVGFDKLGDVSDLLMVVSGMADAKKKSKAKGSR